MKIFQIAFLSLFALLLLGCQQNNHYDKSIVEDPEYLHRSLKQLTDVIVHDIFSPPVASRIYAYSCIAAYEILEQTDDSYLSLSSQITDYQGITPIADTLVNPHVAAVNALNKIGQRLIFSEDKMQKNIDSLHKEWLSLGVPERVLEASYAYADQVVAELWSWIDRDMYKQTRTYPQFSVRDEPGRWKPTPPAYMQGIEPSWNVIRTLVIDSAAQFAPAPPPAFSVAPGSEFRRLVDEVYDAVNKRTKEHEAIAQFWDCNPYIMHTTGHVMFATKKITPGGHWMGIAKIACKMKDLDMLASAESYTLTSLALFDGFISCWDEKYRSALIRPETVINEHIDPDWLPVLQTPPFPEHTSGHSVISSAASMVLTSLFGDNFAFEDTSELEYGLPTRTFRSFIHASDEAAISRLYGGIHYMPAIEDGVKQGKKVGQWIVDHVKTRR